LRTVDLKVLIHAGAHMIPTSVPWSGPSARFGAVCGKMRSACRRPLPVTLEPAFPRGGLFSVCRFSNLARQIRMGRTRVHRRCFAAETRGPYSRVDQPRKMKLSSRIGPCLMRQYGSDRYCRASTISRCAAEWPGWGGNCITLSNAIGSELK
jgi:hypothetical protein